LGEFFDYPPKETGRTVAASGEIRVRSDSMFGLTLSQPAASDLAALAPVVNEGLKRLHVRDLELPPGAIEQLAELEGLEKLDFLSIKLSDDDLAQLAGLGTLKELSFFSVPISDAGVASLAKLPLEGLDLHGTKCTDRVWETIATLRSLKRLRLGDKTISDVGFKRFHQLPNLEWLMFDQLDEISDEAMAHLG